MSTATARSVRCRWCGNDMYQHVSCRPNRLLPGQASSTSVRCITVDPLPFGREYAREMDPYYGEIDRAEYDPIGAITGEGRYSLDPIGSGNEGFDMIEAISPYSARGQRRLRSVLCSDCGVSLKAYHHPGCLNEECPACSRPRVSCNCGPLECNLSINLVAAEQNAADLERDRKLAEQNEMRITTTLSVVLSGSQPITIKENRFDDWLNPPAKPPKPKLEGYYDLDDVEKK